MQFTAPAGELAKLFALIASALPDSEKRIVQARSLQAIHITADAAGVSFSAHVFERLIRGRTAAHVDAAGEAATPGPALAKLVAAFPADTELVIAADAKALSVRTGRTRHALPVRALADLPASLHIEPAEIVGDVALSGEACLTLLEAGFAAAAEETRSYLNGLCLRNVDDRLYAVATDGVMLVQQSTPAATTLSIDFDCIVPLASVKLAVKLLKKTKPATVQLRRSPHLLEISTPQLTLISKLIAGNFPDYRRLIPATADRSFTVQRAELLAALERLEAVHKVDMPIAGLSWQDGGRVALSLLREPDAASDEIAATCSGQARIPVALSKFHELVDQLPAETLTIEQAEDGGPLRITAHGSEMLVLLAVAHWPNKPADPQQVCARGLMPHSPQHSETRERAQGGRHRRKANGTRSTQRRQCIHASGEVRRKGRQADAA